VGFLSGQATEQKGFVAELTKMDSEVESPSKIDTSGSLR
jgi:hypothetical protein